MIATETLPIVVENRVVPRLLYSLIDPLSAGSIQQKRSFLADKKGQPIASAAFTLIDDASLPGGLRSAPFDGDGFLSRRRVVVDKGVLKSPTTSSSSGTSWSRWRTTPGPTAPSRRRASRSRTSSSRAYRSPPGGRAR